jgi:hypothetical protein
MTRRRPRVAMTSERRWPRLARWWVEMLTAARPYMRFAAIAPVMQPATWAGR